MEKKDIRMKQFTSNLVLMAKQSERTRPKGEATGEPESLWGNLDGKKMGDRASYNKRQEKSKNNLKETFERVKSMSVSSSNNNKGKLFSSFSLNSNKKRKIGDLDVLDVCYDEIGRYEPRSNETREYYRSYLSIVRGLIGDLPNDVLLDFAFESIKIIKSVSSDDVKIDSINKLLSSSSFPISFLSNAVFASLCSIANRLVDFRDDQDVESANVENGDQFNEDDGVAVVFEDDDDPMEGSDDENQIEFEVKGDDELSSDEEDAVDVQMGTSLDTQKGGFDRDQGINEKGILDPHTVGAFWLKGKVAQEIDSDPVMSQKLAEEILDILETEDERECENKLVRLLRFEKFDLVKLLLDNRLTIVWCTRLDHAEDEESKARIEAHMENDPKLRHILHSLQASSLSKQHKLRDGDQCLGITQHNERSDTKPVKLGKIIPLEQFGARILSSKECRLPEGSRRVHAKGREEIIIPASKEPPPMSGETLVSISSSHPHLPPWMGTAFSGTSHLNRIQSRLAKTTLESQTNLLLCAPTGSGKTNVAMLCILSLMNKETSLILEDDNPSNTLDNMGFEDFVNWLPLDAFKVIYVAPMKSLVQEMVGNFGTRLKPYGMKVSELTGDANMSKQQIKETQLIITTPEKWDIITRKSGDRTLMETVKLVILDEVHLLHDERGPVLECLVARTIRQVEDTGMQVRLIGLSATLPNYEDVATFLRVPPENVFAFPNSFRPVPLEQHFVGLTEKKPTKRIALMNEVVYEKVMDQAGENQCLIFVHSRKETVNCARVLRDLALASDELGKFLQHHSASREILQLEAENSARNGDLKELLPYGFGIHHAGLQRTDRNLVEDLFADGHIQVLVSTATLAWGVNLPAHCVIIRGTQIYNPEKASWTELSPMDVMQMLGRSGRPPYDTYGIGIVLTSHSQLQYYLTLMNEQLSIESQFISKLPDNLNAEIVFGSVRNVEEGVDWLAYTYLYICMLRNPTLYGIDYDSAEEDKFLEQRRRDLIHTAATILDKANLIRYDRNTGKFQPTHLGQVASHYYVTHASMAEYNEHLKPTLGDIELFRLFSLSHEFRYVSVREEEKPELEKLLDRAPIPVKENIDEPTAKINVLLQAYISDLKLDGFALQADLVYITQSAARLMRALFEIVLKRGWASLSERILSLCKMVDKRMWSTQSPLRQFPDIPEDISKKLERKEFQMDRLYDLEAHEIGELVSFHKMGNTIYRRVNEFPRVELTAHVQPITRQILRVELTIIPDFNWNERSHGTTEPFWIIVHDQDGELILHHEYFLLKSKFSEEEHVVDFVLPLFEPLHPQYFVKFVSDKWLGAETTLALSFRHLILPNKFPPHTELLDLKPIPSSELRNSSYERLYPPGFILNPIQTQCFRVLYLSDSNAFIGAPCGSGKSLFAELAFLRLLNIHKENSKCVYIAPLKSVCQQKYLDWRKRLGELLNVRVGMLTGENSRDLSLLSESQLVIGTPEEWNTLSRRWKQRKSVQAVNLFIADDLHLVSGPTGPTFEIVVSRMRHMSSYLSEATSTDGCRIVGISSSVANFRDLANWIGADPDSSFNFHPNSRPIPLEITVSGFDVPHHGARVLAMSRPLLHAISQQGEGKPILVFVPDRREIRRTAQDLVNYYDEDHPSRTFLKVKLSDIVPHLEMITNGILRETLPSGISLIHDGLSEKDRAISEHLFAAGATQILLTTADMCWGLDSKLNSYLVIIAGTQRYSHHEHRYVDYPISDILEMMGKACRPESDQLNKVVLFCNGPRKEFYKKFLYEPIPIESHLDQCLADHLNAEVVTKTIQNKQDAVDYLTWTLIYRRLAQNPNYYNLQGTDHEHLSDYLSELVESSLADLQESKCVTIVDDFDVQPLNSGMIAAYYDVKYTSIELFNSSLGQNTRMKGLIEIVSSAAEFQEQVPVRRSEAKHLRKLGNHLPLKLESTNYHEISTKVNVLLQAHFSRSQLASYDMQEDQNKVLLLILPMIQAMIDVTSSMGHLSPALSAMELSQMVVQAVWDNDSRLRQIPFFDHSVLRKAASLKEPLESVFDLLDMEDSDRIEFLSDLSQQQVHEVARFCNQYPSINVDFEIVDPGHIAEGNTVKMVVNLSREDTEEEASTPEDPPLVVCPYFPEREKFEAWWLVIGDEQSKTLLSIKRVSPGNFLTTQLMFRAPPQGSYNLTLFLMSDSYVGCDQDFHFSIEVPPHDVEMADIS